MPHVRSVAVGVWICSGSRHETPEQNGISHFIEHMLFKGTENRSAEEIARSVDSIGGNLDAFTSRELVSFNTKVLDEHLPQAFDVLSDMVLHPLFREEDVEKEKGVILEEIKMDADNPEYMAHEIFCVNFWKGHALGRPILGTKATVAGFARDGVRSFYDGIYGPRNLLITAAGNLDHDGLVRMVEDRFAALSAPARVPPSPTPRPHAKIDLRRKRSLEQVHVCLGVPSYEMSHERRYACYVLNAFLGAGMSSRLFQNIREKRGLAYSIFSELNMYSDTGCMSVYAGTSTENARRVIGLILDEFRLLKAEPVPADELRRAKDHIKGSLMLGLESTSSRMANLARQEIFFGRHITMDEILAGVEAVTADEIAKIAAESFHPQNIALTVLGPLNGFKVTRDDLVC